VYVNKKKKGFLFHWSRKYMNLVASQSYGLPRPAAGIALPFRSIALDAIKEDDSTPFVIIGVVSNHSEVAAMWTLLDCG
jgi:hypothetical protein